MTNDAIVKVAYRNDFKIREVFLYFSTRKLVSPDSNAMVRAAAIKPKNVSGRLRASNYHSWRAYRTLSELLLTYNQKLTQLWWVKFKLYLVFKGSREFRVAENVAVMLFCWYEKRINKATHKINIRLKSTNNRQLHFIACTVFGLVFRMSITVRLLRQQSRVLLKKPQ